MANNNAQHNAGDDIAINNARKEEVRRTRNDADVLRAVMHTVAGRAWLYRQLEKCHIFDNPAVPGDTHATYMKLGEQNYGKQLWLEAQNASIELYMKMMAEQNEEQNRRDDVARDLSARNSSPDRPLTPDDQVPYVPAPQGWNDKGKRKKAKE